MTGTINSINSTIGKSLLYDSSSSFEISPSLTAEHRRELEELIDNLILDYQNRNDSNFDCFFWELDRREGQTIVIRDAEFMMEMDCFNQLCRISGWLFSRSYRLSGSYHGVNSNTIETISADGIHPVLYHHYIVETDIVSLDKCRQIIETNVNSVNESNNSIQTYWFPKLYRFDPSIRMMLRTSDDSTNTPIIDFKHIRHEEKLLVIDNLQARIKALETTSRTHNSLLCLIMKTLLTLGIIGTGSFIYINLVR